MSGGGGLGLCDGEWTATVGHDQVALGLGRVRRLGLCPERPVRRFPGAHLRRDAYPPPLPGTFRYRSKHPWNAPFVSLSQDSGTETGGTANSATGFRCEKLD